MKLRESVILFFIGLLGVLSLLSIDIPLPQEVKEELLQQFQSNQIKYLILVNPTILLGLATVIGSLCISHTPFKVWKIDWKVTIFQGTIIGAGVVLFLLVCDAMISHFAWDEMQKLSAFIQPTLLMKVLYGGITEEILMRFGLMTLFCLVFSKLIKKEKVNVWIAIVLSSLLFAIGHLPIAFAVLETPSIFIILYIVIGNTLGGMAFGYVYWKYDLKTAMLAHITTHLHLTLILLLSSYGI
ncbi:MAG: CPBP family intramembrane metalloprotease [Cytophagales bacterium]|nr:CPBP family intramembrane metalloprotease [Cytophagales bacterium]